MRRLAVVALLVIGIAGGYFYASPNLAVRGLRAAIQDHDSAELEERIDFPALRENLKGQINAVMFKGDSAKDLTDNPFGALALGLVTKLTDGIIESLVTPSALAALAQGNRPHADSPTTTEQPTGEPFADARITRDSLSRFSLWVPDKATGEELQFVFRRQGLSWRLSSIFFPQPTPKVSERAVNEPGQRARGEQKVHRRPEAHRKQARLEPNVSTPLAAPDGAGFRETAPAEASVDTATATTRGPSDGREPSPEEAAWQARVMRKMKGIWIVPPGFRTQPLQTRVAVTLDAAGNILGTPRVTQQSGNPWYDDGVMRGLAKASPLPPPPEAGDWVLQFEPGDSL